MLKSWVETKIFRYTELTEMRLCILETLTITRLKILKRQKRQLLQGNAFENDICFFK